MIDKNEKMVEKRTSIEAGATDEIQINYTPEEEKRVLRKIDRVVIPLMCLVEFFQCKRLQKSGFDGNSLTV